MTLAHPLWLIDGHNLLHCIGELRRLSGSDVDAAQELLLQRLQAVSGSLWCFFDGGGQAGVHRQAQQLWRMDAGRQTADDAMLAWLQRHPQRRPVTLVSADRDLQLRARAQGAKVLDPIRFWRRFVPHQQVQSCSPIADQHRALDAQEVEQWLRYFGQD